MFLWRSVSGRSPGSAVAAHVLGLAFPAGQVHRVRLTGRPAEVPDGPAKTGADFRQFLVPNRIMAITITNSKCGTLKKSNMIRPPSERFRGMSVPRHPLKQFHSEIALAAAEADVLRKGIRAM